MKLPKKITSRQEEIVLEFLSLVDAHIGDILEGRADDMHHIKDIAAIMHIHPTHLSNTIKIHTGKSPCYFFEDKLMNIAREMLHNPSTPIAEIAIRLTFDTSNFTKFFKRFEGMTPSAYRHRIHDSLDSLSRESLSLDPFSKRSMH